MGYLEKTGYKRGHAVWRFNLPNKRIHRNTNADALKWYWSARDIESFIAYVRTVEGWKKVVSSSPAEQCGCGRAYDNTPSGEPFRFQEHQLVYTIESVSSVMCSPVLCMVCYYKNELNEGRWAPRFVKRELGLEP